MSRRRFCFIALSILTLAGVVTSWLLWPRSAICPENAAKIRDGMTLQEVDTILGGPARDEATGLRLLGERVIINCGPERRLQTPGVWVSDSVIVKLNVDNGVVESHYWAPLRSINESPFDIIRRWLRL